MRHNVQLKQLCWAWLATIWSCSAWAAQATFAGDLAAIPPAAFAVSVLLAVIGGAAFTAQKMADPATVVKSVLLEIVKDILASIVAGLLTFFICAWMEFAAVLQAACITIAGYGGSRVLERYLGGALRSIDRLGGKEGSP
ncbi:MAG: phage holin family protein [Pseudomonadota bacterium]